MAWSEKDFCIKCDRGGNVLVCSNSSCPLAVHEKCLCFPAKFDELGMFYCPYCVYRRLVVESHQLREKALSRKKALSNFLDMKLINGDCQTQESGKSKQKEPTQLLDAEKLNGCSEDDENGLEKVNVCKHPVLDKEDLQEDRFAPECIKQLSPSKDANNLFLGNQYNGSSSKYAEIAGASDCNHRLVVVGYRTASGPIVVCGKDYVGSEEEETTEQFEMVEIGNRIQLQPHQQHDDLQPQGTVENHLDDNHFIDPLIIERQRREDDIPSQAKKVGNDAITVQENDASTVQENDASTVQENDANIGQLEEVEEQVDKTGAFSHSDPALQVHLVEKRALDASDLIFRDSKTALNGKRTKHNDNSKDQSTDANCSRRPSQNSASPLRTHVDHMEEINASCKSGQITKLASAMNLPSNGRRKSLPWTEEEVDMLKEGVQNFSSDMNKNIPWRKILEFGRHVFVDTRTPVDLKDKWRNMLNKER